MRNFLDSMVVDDVFSIWQIYNPWWQSTTLTPGRRVWYNSGPHLGYDSRDPKCSQSTSDRSSITLPAEKIIDSALHRAHDMGDHLKIQAGILAHTHETPRIRYRSGGSTTCITCIREYLRYIQHHRCQYTARPLIRTIASARETPEPRATNIYKGR
jgi:hypothetical protein